MINLFYYNIWGADLAGIQMISKFNKGIRFLLCAADIFSKYRWIAPLRDRIGISQYLCFSENFKRIS